MNYLERKTIEQVSERRDNKCSSCAAKYVEGGRSIAGGGGDAAAAAKTEEGTDGRKWGRNDDGRRVRGMSGKEKEDDGDRRGRRQREEGRPGKVAGTTGDGGGKGPVR